MVRKIKYSVRLQDGGEKEMYSNQLIIGVIRSEVEEEIEVREVDMIPEVGEELREVEIIPDIGEDFEDGVYMKEEELGVNIYNDEEEIEDVVLNDDRERHWWMVIDDNNGRVDGKKSLHHVKRWDV